MAFTTSPTPSTQISTPASRRSCTTTATAGNDEYELATPSWSMDPTPVRGDRPTAPRSCGRDPIATGRRLTADASTALQEALQLGYATAAAHGSPHHLAPRRHRWQRAKDIYVLENLGARHVLHELARRAHSRGGPAGVRLAFCVTIDELADFVADPSAFADVIAQRSDQQRYLDARIPPLWFQGRIPPPRPGQFVPTPTQLRPRAARSRASR